MGYYNPKLVKRLKQQQSRGLGVGLIVGCLLVAMTYVAVLRTDIDLLSIREFLFYFTSLFEDVGAQRQSKPLCDLSEYRTDVCDMDGDIRIVGKGSSTVMLVPPNGSSSGTSESWEVKPYARKWDRTVTRNIRKVNVKSLQKHEEAPVCSVHHTVPGVLFASAGYCGNIFHDVADVLLPLFITSRGFDGNVQFLVANNQSWWFYKYHHILQKLSSHELINYDHDDRVHCFKHVIVGLRADNDLMIDASRSAQGLSMLDFVRFLRSSYSLERDRPWTAGGPPGRKPRLLFIARGRSRRFVNLDEIVPVAEQVGFEVVMAEPSFMDVGRFAGTVNSCDVMVGVHGAGLTNMVFLPTNAVLIQVVPLAKLDWIAANYYGEPAKGMKLRYLQYEISEEESTLLELYPRDHKVFKDPDSIHKQGWKKMGEVYLRKQNVKLNVNRFRPVLEKALQLLKEKAEHTTE
ncbi:hypothetical protein GW17_00054826 [Ensete ventricosum]|nr:hypothetical protein GW17_00054826 [Ensete ventricosum]RZS12373.1 hypothetical protein BHM03_00043793 [Ensete ventricosum]